MSSPHGHRDVSHGRLAGPQGRSSPKQGSYLGLARGIDPFIHGPRSGSGRDWKPCVRSPSIQTRRLRFSTNARLGDLRTVRHSGGQIGRGKNVMANQMPRVRLPLLASTGGMVRGTTPTTWVAGQSTGNLCRIWHKFSGQSRWTRGPVHLG